MNNDLNTQTLFAKKDRVSNSQLNNEVFKYNIVGEQKKREENVELIKRNDSGKEVYKYLDELNLKITRLKHEMSKKLKQDDRFTQQRNELKTAFEQLEKKIFQSMIETIDHNSHHKRADFPNKKNH